MGIAFRPCLEDVLQMLILEFGLDTKPDWLAAVEKGRARWRDIQLRAAVRDAPESAAEDLRGLGYEVIPPLQTPLENAARQRAF